MSHLYRFPAERWTDVVYASDCSCFQVLEGMNRVRFQLYALAVFHVFVPLCTVPPSLLLEYVKRTVSCYG